jgi:hypothetical protein
MKQMVARPLANMVVEIWKLVISATATVAGNITITCCNAYSSSFHIGGFSSGRYPITCLVFSMIKNPPYNKFLIENFFK